MSVLANVRDQHPFVYAREKFLAGEMLIDQAVAMIVRDSDFAYEAMLAGKDVRAAAEMVVRKIWMAELVKIVQQRKQGLALLQTGR